MLVPLQLLGVLSKTPLRVSCGEREDRSKLVMATESEWLSFAKGSLEDGGTGVREGQPELA